MRRQPGFRGGAIPPVNPAAGMMDLLARITVLEQDKSDLLRVIGVLVTRLGGQVTITTEDLTAAPAHLERDDDLDGMIIRVRQ